MESAKIEKFKVFYRNKEEFEDIRDEIFEKEEYQFFSEKDDPLIIDCGSHIGLSILYFKSRYPQSKILGFEPNPENFKILTKNIQENKLENVKVINAALSDKTGITDFWTGIDNKNPWTWGDSIVENLWYGRDKSKKIKVKTVKLSSYITESVDYLKLDIEGAEGMVLNEIRNKLKFIKKMLIEFHGTKTNKKQNNLVKIKRILKRNNFVLRFSLRELRLLLPEIFWGFSSKAWNGKIYAVNKINT